MHDKQYHFYCLICGEGFATIDKNQRSDTPECAVVLARLRGWPVPADKQIDPSIVDMLYRQVTNETINPAILKTIPKKPDSEEPSTIAKLTGRIRPQEPEPAEDVKEKATEMAEAVIEKKVAKATKESEKSKVKAAEEEKKAKRTDARERKNARKEKHKK